MREDAHWWRCNRSIRYYGLLALAGTQLADIVTTAVGVWFVPTIVEANPVADRLFAEVGLLAGLLLAGGLTVVFAAGAAELFGIEVRRRSGCRRPRCSHSFRSTSRCRRFSGPSRSTTAC